MKLYTVTVSITAEVEVFAEDDYDADLSARTWAEGQTDGLVLDVEVTEVSEEYELVGSAA
jgi:hypothetical protein